jgi:hypothetical protein
VPRPRLAPSLLLLLGVLAWSPAAYAGTWQEAHESAADVRLEVGSDGIATVQHRLRYRVVAGHFRSFDLVGIDLRAELSPDAVLTPEKGGVETPVRVEPVAKAPGTVRILVDEGKGLTRGAYVVDVKYKLDLVATNLLTRDGAMWKIAWTAPPAPEGHDGARVVFELPSAPTEPRLAAAAESTTTLATLRRTTGRDELELVRAHVPRGEAVTWAARVDPKAFPRVTSPELRPPPPVETAPPAILGTNARRALVAVGFALLAFAFAALLDRKQRTVRAAAELGAARARPLLALPLGAGPFVYGVVTSLALALLLWSSPVAGALLVALAMALAAHRSPVPVARPRAPGAWRLLPDAQAFAGARNGPLPSDVLDVGQPRARWTFLLCTLLVGALTWLLRRWIPQVAIALPLTWAAIVPIFFTGTRAQLTPAPAELGARLLRPARDVLAATLDLAHVELGTLGRVVGAPEGAASPEIDELRLLCVPRDRTPGLRAIELAIASAPGGHVAVPEVFVRFDEGSATADRVARLAVEPPVASGRAPEERVARLSPDEPTARSAAALVAELVLALEGRRASDRPESARATAPAHGWRGRERRRSIVRAALRRAPATAR